MAASPETPAEAPSYEHLLSDPPKLQTDAKWNVRLDMQIVAVPVQAAPELISGFQDRRRSDDAAATVEKMITNATADLIAWPVLWTADGGWAGAETIAEARYPSEFEPPQFPRQTPVKMTARRLFADGIPNAFETRNLGVTLTAHVQVHPDGTMVDLAIVPQRVALAGFHRYRLYRSANGLEAFIDQPEFCTHKTTTNLTVRSGERQILGAFYGSKPDDKVIIFIVRAVIMPVPGLSFEK